MKRNLLLFFGIVFVFVSGMMPSCTYNNEETLYKPKPCDTNSVSAISFKTTVAPLIKTNCTDKGCHVGSNPIGLFTLETYDDIKTQALVRRDGNNIIYGSLEHLPGFQEMPQNATPLVDCDIKKINAWINAGAKDN